MATQQWSRPTNISELLRANRRNRDPLLKYGNRDLMFAPQGVNLKQDPVVYFKMHQFLCPICTNHWQKGSKEAGNGCFCRNCHLYLLPYLTRYGKTPYQGLRRMIGLFQCPCCPRFWPSSCSWAEMSQQCRQCGAKVYPYQQLSLRERDRFPPTPPVVSQATTSNTDRKHMSELCERCFRTGSCCTGGFLRNLPMPQHFTGARAEASVASGSPRGSRHKEFTPGRCHDEPRKLDNPVEVDAIQSVSNVAETITTTTTTTEEKTTTVERTVQSQSGRSAGVGGDTAEFGSGQSRCTKKKSKKVIKLCRRVTKKVQTLPTIEEIPVVLARPKQMPISGEDGEPTPRAGHETKPVDRIHALELELQDVCLTDRPSVSCWKK